MARQRHNKRAQRADRRKYSGTSANVVEANTTLKSPPAGDHGYVIAPSQKAIREALEAQICPWCGRGPFKVVAGHVTQQHGVGRRELREMAGLPWTATICSPEHSADRSAIAKASGNVLPPGSQKGQRRSYSPAGFASMRAAAKKASTGRPASDAQLAAAKVNGALRGQQMLKPRQPCIVCGATVPYRPGNAQQMTCSSDCLQINRRQVASAARARGTTPAQSQAARANARAGWETRRMNRDAAAS